jgi:hypothetical protein
VDIITYSLINGAQNSELYYKEISFFSNTVLNKLQKISKLIIDDFSNFIKENNLEVCSSQEEYMVEFLAMGVFLNIYSLRAKKLKPVSQKLLSYLSRIRNKNSLMKPAVDGCRGVLSTIFLTENKQTGNEEVQLSLIDLENLLAWMDASGDFKFASQRLKNWYDFLGQRSEIYSRNVINQAASLGRWFKSEGKQVLGKYTPAVDSFLCDKHPAYRFREDIIFCGRKEEEYHLNMVGAEILNRAFREDFLKTKIKMVLLPACMRFHTSKLCKAVRSSDGYLCTNCSPECKVNKLTELGRQKNFTVYIIPHESDAFENNHIENSQIGVVGIACILNLLEGGWKAKALNFIPQCVLLDYCGCKNHWHPKGIKTDINMEQLKRILQM